MAEPPSLSHTAGRVYDAVAPMAWDDDAQGYALAHFSGALASMFDTVADLSRDQDDGTPGWAALFDPDRIPLPMLPWLGQLVGVDVPETLPEAAQRLRVKETGGFRRGTPAALQGAARQHLTDSRTVYLLERHGGPYHLTLSTLASETPDPEAVRRAVLQQKPAGLVLTVSVVAGGDFLTLRDTHTSFEQVRDVFASFGDVRADPAQT